MANHDNENPKTGNDEIIPLQGEIVDKSESPFGNENRPPDRKEIPTRGIKSFNLRWQTGCLGCLIPFTFLFLLFFYLFRLGLSALGG
ncbi:MAG: hypothetical protein ACJ0BL_00120 [Dehalococcoidia bacterium]